MSLTYAQRQKARGMLADKQGINSIAEEFECHPSEIQALADAKPKPVRVCQRRELLLLPAALILSLFRQLSRSHTSLCLFFLFSLVRRRR